MTPHKDLTQPHADHTADVIIIGAGPSGALSAARLVQAGHSVLVLERQHFPRFSIGESLLPQSMQFLEEAGMLDAVIKEGFQFKNGAAFSHKERYDYFDFREKFSDGWGTTFQVQRNRFDQILADEAARFGALIEYGQTVTAYQETEQGVSLTVQDEAGLERTVHARFVLDASGFGRVLPKLLGLERNSTLASRASLFTHVEDRISHPDFDRDKILITVHPEHPEIWYWLIPFSNGRASVGVVVPREHLANMEGDEADQLKALIKAAGWKAEVLADAVFDTRVGKLESYSCDVIQLYGERFALLGNAGEFLDPVFSSGVTIALKSAHLASQALDKTLKGEAVNWEQEYAEPLKLGVNTFRAFVEGWYNQDLQTVIFTQDKTDQIKRMISSILAGYAWDTDNPYVASPKRLATLARLCEQAEVTA